jgi:hypothetical protein
LIEIGTLAAPNPAFLDVFGSSVGVDANYVYVGATGRDNGAGRVGSVTIFKPALLAGYQLQAFVGARTTNPAWLDVDNGGWWEFGTSDVIFKDGFQ